MFDDDLGFIGWFGIILLILAVVHSIMWLITKGIIWVIYGLFNINWCSKFWYVYVLILIVSAIFGGSSYKKGE